MSATSPKNTAAQGPSKAELRAERKAEKQAIKARKKANKKPGVFKQLGQVFTMTKAYDPSIVWWMLLGFLAPVVIGLVIGLLLNNWITWLILGIAIGLLVAVILLNRRGERAAFAQIEDRPGAAGAALGTLRRGWIVEEEPVAITPRSQDVVFRAIGRPGVVLVTEGPIGRVRKLVQKQRQFVNRVAPNVPVHVIHVGKGEGQTELHQVVKTMKGYDKALTKHEVQAVNQRLSSITGQGLPIPKGIDPYRMRPDRKALRGR